MNAFVYCLALAAIGVVALLAGLLFWWRRNRRLAREWATFVMDPVRPLRRSHIVVDGAGRGKSLVARVTLVPRTHGRIARR